MFTTPTCAGYYCPCNGFSFFVFQLSQFNAYTPSLFAAAAAICCPVLWQWLFLPPIVCLNPSLSLSVYLSPSLHAASLFLLWHRAALSSLCLPLSLILPTGNNSLSSLSLPPPSPYLAGYIGSSVRCLGLWQPVSYSKWFWHSCAWECVQCGNPCVCQCVCVVCLVCAHAQSD